MNAVRLIVLAVAALAAVFAAVFVRGAMQQPAAAPAPVIAAPEPALSRVLVAARDIAPAERVTAGDFRWADWPEEAVMPAFMTQASNADALETLSGSVARGAFAAGEPVLPGKLVHPGEAGFMAAVIDPGMRAVAVPISAESSAGGFILPNDRVDILVTVDGPERGYVSNLIVENVRVLAIDQTYVEEGDSVVLGSTATLELSPDQTREVARAVVEGDIVLALRSVADRAGGPRLPGAQTADRSAEQVVRVIRYGQEQRVALGGAP